MRWLACHPGPHFSVSDVHAGWVEALENAGQKVVEYPFGDALQWYSLVLVQRGEGEFRRALTNEQAISLASDRLCAALYKVRPDVLLLTSGFFLDPLVFDRARADGVKVVLICTEQPYELPRELKLAEHCDAVLLNDPTHLAQFQAVTQAWYQPHSYRPTLHSPGPSVPDLVCDLAFVGTAYASRAAWFEALDGAGYLDGLDVLLAGNWQALGENSALRPFVAHDFDECTPNEKTVDIYRSARVGLNLYRREAERPELAEGWSIGPREVEMAAVGLPFLRDPRPEGDELFPMLPRFTTPAEAGELLRWFLDHPDERQSAADKAREAIADRTFDNAVARLLRHLERST